MSVTVVKVLVERNGDRIFVGTAFFINNRTLITAGHVIAYTENDDIYLRDTPKGGDLKVDKDNITMCKKRDVAILRLSEKLNIEQVEISFNLLEIGVQVEIEGYYDLHGGVKTYEHKISASSNEQFTYELQNHLTEGLSGSPVLINNKIVGIAQAISRDKNITYIIPISECCYDFKLEKKNKSIKFTKQNIFKFFIAFIIVMFTYLCVSEIGELRESERSFSKIRRLWDEKRANTDEALNVAKGLEDINERYLLLPKYKISKYMNTAYAYAIVADLHGSPANREINGKKSLKFAKQALRLIKNLEHDDWLDNAKMITNYSMLISNLYIVQAENNERKKLELLKKSKEYFKEIKKWYYDNHIINQKDIIEKNLNLLE